MARIRKWLLANWERLIFSLLGLGLLGWSLKWIADDRVTQAAAIFGLGFLSMIYANLSRFKRFKGLGFEGELWEDTKKEAEGLIDRLRSVVAIYSREIIRSSVTAGRWGLGAGAWKARWSLFHEIRGQHEALGQKIDFTETKAFMDQYFLFDLTMPLVSRVRRTIMDGKTEAQRRISEKFGQVIVDPEGYDKELSKLRAIEAEIDDPFETAKRVNLAEMASQIFQASKAKLEEDFDVTVTLEPEWTQRLKDLVLLWNARPLTITDELIDWADKGLQNG